MAEKEERILIARSSDYTLTDTDKGALFEGKIAPHCANVFTRQEAIEKMAKAFCETGAPNTWGLVEEHYKKFCLAGAEAALNALLEKGEEK